MAPSSAYSNAPANEISPAAIQTKMSAGPDGNTWAITAGLMKMLTPITHPTTIESVGQKVRSRESSRWWLRDGVLTVRWAMFEDIGRSEPGRQVRERGHSRSRNPVQDSRK